MPASGPRQLRLLLWKDYLTRKRKLITLGGVLWATAVMLSIYIVRVNVDSAEYPTCQFPARALPSAGMLPFLQSFICSVNNECETLNKYDPIPSYENATLNQLQREFSPLLNNETVLEVAAAVPDALKLLSRLADIFDEETFVDISKNGLKVEDLFDNPKRTKRYISKRLELRDDVTGSLMKAQLSFEGLFKGNLNQCSAESISQTIILENKEHLEVLVLKLCSLSEEDVSGMLRDLLLQFNFNKFLKMVGSMYQKLSGDSSVTRLADMVTAVLRMSSLQHFLPQELVALIDEDADFSYFQLDLIQKFVNLFEPVFAETDGFKSIQTVSDTIVQVLRYLNKIWAKQRHDSNDIIPDKDTAEEKGSIDKVSSDVTDNIEDNPIAIFDILSRVTTLIHKILPDGLKHDVLLYSTLLTKLIESANRVIDININIEERAYDVALRHPEGVKILVNLPSVVIAKAFDAMADAERMQVMTAKINNPGQMFCDLNRLQAFFNIGKDEAVSLRNQLCTDAWKNYVVDLVKSFGIYEIKNNINAMASLVIQETLGRDISDQLYSIDHDFQVLKNFTLHLTSLRGDTKTIDWLRLFNMTEESEFMRTARSKGHLGKQMLIVFHGSLAKEVVKQNPILSYKISPGFIDATTLVSALNRQLDATSQSLVEEVKMMYPVILETVVLTALDEDRTYRALSTHSENILCNGTLNALMYLVLPKDVNQDKLVETLCAISKAIEGGLEKDSIFGKAIQTIRTSKHTPLEEVKWTTLITGLKSLYVKLDRDCPYLFEYKSYGMSEELRRQVERVVEKAKVFWFGSGNLGRGVHLGLKFGFRLLDLMDRDIFNITGEGWGMTKYSLHVLSGPMIVFDDFVKSLVAIHENRTYVSNLPPSTVQALERIVPNIPLLMMDTAQIIVNDDFDTEAIISILNTKPAWPCAASLTSLLPLSPGSVEAITGLETIWCMDDNFTEEWTRYLDERNVALFDIKKWNTTVYPPHVFLKFSGAIDGLIDDGVEIRAVVEGIANDTDGSWVRAWQTITEIIQRDDRDAVLTRFFRKLDNCITSAETLTSDLPLSSILSTYLSCRGQCADAARAAWKGLLQFASVTSFNVASDLLEYFREINEPNSTVLQMMGFTRDTALFELYDKLPDFMGVLLHSYWDYGFMSQIRRAALTTFWDCEAVVESLVVPPGSRLSTANILRVKPYVCPSFLYWISLPKGDNKFLDVVSKPQYYYYTLPSENLTSSYENAYTTIMELTNFLQNQTKKNQTRITDEDIQISSIKTKFSKTVHSIVNYRIKEDDSSYNNFHDINKKYFATSVYLTRIVSVVNKIAVTANNLTIEDLEVSEERKKKVEADINSLKKAFKRRAVDAIQMHFNLITDLVWANNESYTLTEAIESACINLKNNDTSKVILQNNKRMILQICSMEFKEIFGLLERVVKDDFEGVRASLMNLVKVLKDENDVTDIFAFFTERDQLLSSLRNSIQYSYDLSLPIYLQYLQSNIRHYDVISSFLTGGDWWGELRGIYNGPRANRFFDTAEMGFEIAEDVITGLDRIHLVRLLRDINVNNSEAFCSPSIIPSDYLPDFSGRLSALKADLCEGDTASLFKELPPLLFASQGYDSGLKLAPAVNYTKLNEDLSKTEYNIVLLNNGPKSPQRPPWATEERLARVEEVAIKLLDKESLVRIAFGVVSNVVDASTLFLNNSDCAVCSTLTSWVKQLNLQIFKKQEYHSLLCRMKDMSLNDVHHALQNDFHWDMAVGELVQTRNYTKYELNKSLQEFVELMKLYMLEDLLANSNRLADCLNRNVSRNAVGNATLVINVLSHVARLMRAEVPHLHSIEGLTSLPYVKHMSAKISPRLDVFAPLKKYVNTDAKLDFVDILEGHVNLRLINQHLPINKYVKLQNSSWQYVCSKYNCSELSEQIQNNVNKSLVKKDLPALQMQEFARFPFVSNILYHLESALSHSGRMIGVFSRVEIKEVMEGKLAALVDFLLEILTDDVTADIVYSLHGLVEELQPLLENTTLQFDLQSVGAGVSILNQFKNYLLERDLKLEVSTIFSNPERVESSLSRLGINNTNFWSLAAPRLLAGHIDLTPLLSSKPGSHVSHWACQLDSVARVAVAGALDVVTAEDVAAALVEQWCPLDDHTAKRAMLVLLQNLNLTTIFNKVANILLPKLYSSANLTEAEGELVVEKYPQMAALLPALQGNLGNLGDTIGNEPLLQSLKASSSVGQLLGSPDFLSRVGHTLCGKPFYTEQNRFYKAIAESEDFSDEPVQEQLDALPTDFCRGLYKDILSMSGGKIVWTFVKPLIMGKILYSPVNPTVERIIQQANSTFSHMISLVNLVHAFSAAFPSLGELSQHRSGVIALRSALASPAFSGLKTTLVGDASVPDVDPGVFDQFEDLKGLGSVLKKGSDLLHCFNLNRFRAVADEVQLTHEAAKLSRVNEFSAGLVFLNSERRDYIKNVEYKIRMDIDNVPTTARTKNYLWIPGPESSFIEHMRYFRGFVQIQDLVDTAIVQLSRSNSSRSKREAETEHQWTVYTQQEPYPCYTKDFFQTSLYESQALMVALFFSLLFSVASYVRFIVGDKESGNTLLMSVMGVDLTNHTFSWFLCSLLELAVTAACVTAVLCAGHVLPRTDASLVLCLLLLFGCSVLAFCYMVSKLFTSASLAAVCAPIAYLMTFMPFVLILSLEAVLSFGLKLIVCLSMSTSICYAFLNITRAEARGVGTGWSQLWDRADGDLSIGEASCMTILDSLLYFAVGYVLDRLFGPKTLQSNITHCTSSDEKAGVSIINVTKIYKEGSRRQKVALDNVSIELYKGQVTTLLGHNGAGKTTLIKILTGMIKPSQGSVVVREARGEARGVAAGVCPQRDVLFDTLTAREHVALYAQLKSGQTRQEVQQEIDDMMSVLSLGPVADEPVSRLSGGTRRRLCVALAFVGQPHLVSLDEPTAGVDPAHRRDIWSMIVKLREDRTILLTTHHLDEAELLSDQIVILHKGQVHTTGSPIDIKRALGDGYKLSVLYPKIPEPWPEEAPSIGERSKQLLTVVRGAVKNATVNEMNGLEMEVGLPFFDANGLNNNFLSLCSSLEQCQSELGFTSYSLDCASLEQVFFNITQQADAPAHEAIRYEGEDEPSTSASTPSVRSERSLVPAQGPLRAAAARQALALLRARYTHTVRNRWLLFLLFVIPTVFIATAMAFSLVRPPPDNEVPLRLHPDIYRGSTEYIVSKPSIYSDIESTFAERVLETLVMGKHTKDWNANDTPNCTCEKSKQICEKNEVARPEMMVLPDLDTLNQWIVSTHDNYIENRYTGYSAVLKNNITYLVAWYNNKGHHAMPAVLSKLHSAALRVVSGDRNANITVRSHPLKISKEQLSKDTVYQHVADAGISGLVLIAYSLVGAGGAASLVSARRSQQKRLQLLCGVSPALYWLTTLAADMLIIIINLVITAVVFEAFGFPVFVARSNLPAICLLILLYGYACGSLTHILEKVFAEASLANMVLFCGYAFAGLAGITLLLILDIISDSEETDNARRVLHKILLICPQFVLGDGMIEIAKNTIQAQVLERFGMDTYKSPLTSSLLELHYIALAVVGTVLLLFNLALEYDCFEGILARFRKESMPEKSGEMEDMDVAAERKRVLGGLRDYGPLRISTLGNINAGFVDTVVKNNSIERYASTAVDVAQCVRLGKAYPALAGSRRAVAELTLGLPPSQCTALLGENGAGKSTTFAMLTGEVRPTAGQIYLNGEPASPRQLCRGLISYCPQSDAIDPLLTVRETLLFYCRLRGIDEQDDVIRRTMEMFDLTKYSAVRSGDLSGGNKRKLCAAIAFMGRTPLVLLDEPTSGMDPGGRARVRRGVAAAAAAAARAVLLSTHALDDARRLAARVALLRNGQLCALAPLDDCLRRFGGGYVVACRCRGSARATWLRVRCAAPQARLRVLHHSALHFLLPTTATVGGKEVTLNLSDIFRLMARLQAACDIEDYTLNQSSLDQMFLSFTEKGDELEPTDLEPLPSIAEQTNDQRHSITSL